MSDETISDEEIDVVYRQMIDSFIDRANELADQNGPENTGMALLFAASRFNAFVVSQHAQTEEAFEADLPRAREFFRGQYEKMLEENLEDYRKIYGKYSSFTRKQ